MTNIKRILKKYPTVGKLKNDDDLKSLLGETENLFREVAVALSKEISDIRSNPLYNVALSAAFQVASNALMQPYEDVGYLKDIRGILLSSALPKSTVKKVEQDNGEESKK